jgi:threonine dehydratase
MNTNDITLRDIYQAWQRIAGIVARTPLIESEALSELAGAQVRIKLENLQVTGSFKLRGATNKIMGLTDEERARGVITVSSGNHGRAVAYISQKLSVRAVIVISEPVPENKRQSIRKLGAELIVGGEDYDQALVFADRLKEARGLTMVHAFDDPLVIAGQGTIGLEMIDDFPEIDTAIVPISGGGLISGIALCLKSIHPAIRIIGVSMERGPAMVESLKAGKIVEIVEEPTLADALAGGLNLDNAYTFRMVGEYVDETVLVSEEEIAAGMAFALDEHHQVLEGGGAVGIAALLNKKTKVTGENIAIIASGGNVSMPVLLEVMARQQNRNG